MIESILDRCPSPRMGRRRQRRHGHAHLQGAGQGDPPEYPRAGGPARTGRRPALRRGRAEPLWVRVPVYIGDLERLRRTKPAGVGSLADPPGVKIRPARPVVAPASGDPLAATVSLFLRGQQQGPLLPAGPAMASPCCSRGTESLAVPRSALIRDAFGDTWAYESIAPHVGTHRRVFVGASSATSPADRRAQARGSHLAAAELYGAKSVI